MPALVVYALGDPECLGRVQCELFLDGALIEVDRGVIRHLYCDRALFLVIGIVRWRNETKAVNVCHAR